MKTVLFATLFVSTAALAGDLTPPPGPVAPTMKTLDEVEARTPINDENTPGNAGARFIITSPGSYYLTGDVNAGIDQHGININASGVSIDLNGFRIVGSEDSFGPMNGIEASSIADLTVTNGTITLFTGRGIQAETGARLVDLTLSENGLNGVQLGTDAMITGCISTINGGIGFLAGTGAVVRDSIASGNGDTGFVLFSTSSVNGCTARANDANGFSMGNDSRVTGCTAEGNGSIGFELGDDSRIESCVSSGNETGYIGITGCTITGCTANSNTDFGIAVGNDCVVTGNTCRDHTNPSPGSDAVGIQSVNFNNLIDDNRVIGNDIGIQTFDAFDAVTRNYAEGNGDNYDLSGVSRVGPIQTTYTGAGPWDNFDF